jgi:Fatty acid hydroxylase superfamily
MRTPTRSPTRSLRSVATRGDAAQVFARHRSPQILAAGLATVGTLRVRARRVDRRDAVLVGAIVALRGVHEWVIHRGLLHAEPRTVRGVVIDPGAGHRSHHRDPDVLDDALLTPRDAAQFLVMLAVYVSAACLPWRRHLSARHVLSAIGASYSALVLYEWTHFIDHTTVPLHSRRSRALRAHHRLHHHRDETRWLGITSTTGDVLFRTRTVAKVHHLDETLNEVRR